MDECDVAFGVALCCIQRNSEIATSEVFDVASAKSRGSVLCCIVLHCVAPDVALNAQMQHNATQCNTETQHSC